MNGQENLPLDQTVLDRLVDGELSREEYESVLRMLDGAPDGWRQCAVAFLEAQAWESEVRRMRFADDRPAISHVSVRQAKAGKPWPLLLATAASFLLAFGLGIAFRLPTPLGVQPPTAEFDRLAGVPPETASETPPTGMELASGPLRPGALASPASARASNVTFVLDHGDGSGREVAVPVYELSAENERWLSHRPLAPSLEIQRALERLGRDVRMHRHFIPLETGDGRHVLIPVEQMEITPAGRRAFQ